MSNSELLTTKNSTMNENITEKSEKTEITVDDGNKIKKKESINSPVVEKSTNVENIMNSKWKESDITQESELGEEKKKKEIKTQEMKQKPKERNDISINGEHSDTDSPYYPEGDEYYNIEKERKPEEEEEEEEDEEKKEEKDEKIESSESDFFVGSDTYSVTDSSDLTISDEEKKKADKKNLERRRKRKKEKKANGSKENISVYDNVLSKLNMETAKELEASHIILLGSKDVGKSCLIQALQKIGLIGDTVSDECLYVNVNCTLPLDYACLNVINFEENTKIKNIKGNAHIWIVQHPSYIISLVKQLKKFKNMRRVVVLMCTDLYKPYNIISDLNHWIESLYILFEEFHSSNDLKVYNKLKEKLEDYIYNYKEKSMLKTKENTKDGGVPGSKSNDATNGEKNTEINKKSLIKINLAFPTFFVICKSDGYEILNNRTYQGYIDVIIAYLRNLAIYYQAAIIFCNTANAKEPQNIMLLYKYIMHRLYDFPFSQDAILDNYENIFIPSGYDSLELINESIKNTFVGNFNKPYDSIIIKPMTNKNIVEHSHNVVADVHFNDFLASIKQEMPDNEDESSIKVAHPNEVSDNNYNMLKCESTSAALDGIENDKDAENFNKPLKSTSANKDDGFDKIKKKTKPVSTVTQTGNNTNPTNSSITVDSTTSNIHFTATSMNSNANMNNSVTTFSSSTKRESARKNSLNAENGDQSLHSFFQNLLAKGRTKSQNAPNASTTLETKKK